MTSVISIYIFFKYAESFLRYKGYLLKNGYKRNLIEVTIYSTSNSVTNCDSHCKIYPQSPHP